MVSAEEVKRFHFLADGGEMGELTRSYDWTSTSIGPVSSWSQALKTTVGIILHSDFPMFLWWGDEMIQFYNDAYRPSLGESGKHPKALGQNAVDCWPEIWDLIYPLIDRVKTTGKSFFSEDQLVPIFRNGKIEDVYWTFSYSAVIGEAGNIDGVLVVCNETTKKVNTLKEIESTKKQLELSEANLRNIILQSPVAMCIVKGSAFILEIANDRMYQLLGKPSVALLDKPIFVGLPEAKDQGFEELLDKVYKTGETYTAHGVPVALPRGDKIEVVYVQFVFEALRNGEGDISGVMVVAIDVTEQVTSRHKIEEVVTDRTESLRKSNAELSQFAYITSHDLQEPARKISTFADMLTLSLGENIDQRSKDYLGRIRSSSSRMLKLIRDILSISQLSKVDNEYTRVDLNDVLSEVKEDFELLIEQKGCVIESDTLPVIEAIPVQMSQLFANLISNALKFSSDKMLWVKIGCEVLEKHDVGHYATVKEADQYYKITFTDNGIGFNQENAIQIFDIFTRLHGRTQYEGTGIGLAMCKKIVENHGGYIYAESTPGKGASFHIILPVKNAK